MKPKTYLSCIVESEVNSKIYGSYFVVALVYEKGKTPKGRTREAGYIEVGEEGFVSNVRVQSYLRGKGYGKLLYETAMRHNGFLKTQYHSASFEAKRVWNSLVKKWEHSEDFYSGTLTIYPYPLKAK